MEIRDLRKLVEMMNKNDLVEIEIEEEGRRIRLRKPDGAAPAVVAAAPAAAPAPAAAAGETAPAAAAPEAPAKGVQVITAPMVGTFYRAPSPEADDYVEVGQQVSPDSVVCILEAMKVMNEIKAECAGEIVKVCVQNAEAVEYGQALFEVKVA